MFRIKILLRGLAEDAAWLFSELAYFREAVAIKRARPQTLLIHYCQELLTPEEFPEILTGRFYEQHANMPDLIVDVETHRAAKRIERFNISREVLTLPNTLPLAEVPAMAPPGSLACVGGR